MPRALPRSTRRRERLGQLDPRVRQAALVRPARQVQPAQRAQQAVPVRPGALGQPALRVRRGPPDQPARRVAQARQDQLGRPVRLEPQDQPGPPGRQVLRDRSAGREQPDRQAQLDLPAPRARPGQTRRSPAQQVLLAQQVRPEAQDQPGRPVRRAQTAPLDRQGRQEQQGQPATTEATVQQVLRVPLALRGLQARPAIKARLARTDLPERLARLGLMAQREPRATQDQPGRQAPLAQRVPQASAKPGQQVPRAMTAQRDRLVEPALRVQPVLRTTSSPIRAGSWARLRSSMSP